MISWPYQSQAQRTNFFGDRLAWGVDATERNGLTLRALSPLLYPRLIESNVSPKWSLKFAGGLTLTPCSWLGWRMMIGVPWLRNGRKGRRGLRAVIPAPWPNCLKPTLTPQSQTQLFWAALIRSPKFAWKKHSLNLPFSVFCSRQLGKESETKVPGKVKFSINWCE